MKENILDNIINPNDIQIAKETYASLCNFSGDVKDGDNIIEKAAAIINKCTDNAFENLKEQLPAIYSDFFEKQKEFDELINFYWRNAFMKADTVFVLASDFVENIYNELKTQKSPMLDRQKNNCELMLIGRICQVYREIFCLIEKGYADGAFARARSLYELAVVFEFINISEDYIAESYLATGTDTELRGNDYSWASEAFPQNKKICLSDLQNKCLLTNKNDWDPFLKKANKLLHSSALGTVDRIGLEHDRSTNQVILLGPSMDGLEEPAINSLLLFSRCVYIFSRSYFCGDNILKVMLIDRIANMAIEEFKKLSARISE